MPTDSTGRTLMEKRQTAVIESPPIGAAPVEAGMGLYFFRNSSAVFSQMSCDGFETVVFVKQGFNEDSGFEIQMLLFIHKGLLTAGRKSHVCIKHYKGKIGRIKFHL